MTPENQLIERYWSPPRAVRFMARAFLPSRGLGRDGSLPSLLLRWKDLRISRKHLEGFRALTRGCAEEGVTVLYPHVLGFRLQMALLTHRRFPLPIWGALQIRNSLRLHQRLEIDHPYELEMSPEAVRAVEKGLEIDVVSRLTNEDGECVWDSEVTYFFRGRFGTTTQARTPTPPDLVDATVISSFTMPADGGVRFGKLTGDYNGIHWASWYARLLGFAEAFLHPQRVAGLCMSRLAGPTEVPQRLDLWMKGPVPYGSQVELRKLSEAGDVRFGVSLLGDSRPAVVGHWRAMQASDTGSASNGLVETRSGRSVR